MHLRSLSFCLATTLLSIGVQAAPPADAVPAKVRAPKVMVITLFDGEVKPWLAGVKLPDKVRVPGLSAEFPEVACNADICVATTAMGYANAASSTMALIFSGKFDFRHTYFLVSGIAGVDPANGTLGTAAWADYVVDGGLMHMIDSREAPKSWKSEIVELGAAAPGEKPKWQAGTEVYKLDPALVHAAFEATKAVKLADSPAAVKYRALYPQKAARAKPAVTVCASVSGDTYWHGRIIGEDIEAHVRTLTDGKADYCMTQMEDNAILTAFRRAASAGKVDFKRIAVLRAGSDFDRPHPGQAAVDSLAASSLAYPLGTENAYRVGHAFADYVVAHWDSFAPGLKK